jgi:hypothetical protein
VKKNYRWSICGAGLSIGHAQRAGINRPNLANRVGGANLLPGEQNTSDRQSCTGEKLATR